MCLPDESLRHPPEHFIVDLPLLPEVVAAPQGEVQQGLPVELAEILGLLLRAVGGSGTHGRDGIGADSAQDLS